MNVLKWSCLKTTGLFALSAKAISAFWKFIISPIENDTHSSKLFICNKRKPTTLKGK